MQRKISLGRAARVFATLMVVLATVLPATAVAAPAAAPLAQPEAGTYTGTVFRDYNASGAQNTDQLVTPFLKEPTIAGVIVTAYDSNNTVQGTTTTVRCTAAGAPAAYCTGEDLGPNYSLTTSGTGPYRIEFTLPGDGSLDYLKPGAAGATTVQFVANGGASNVNVGFNNPTDYSQVNPRLVTPRTSYGPRLPVTAGPVSAQEIGLPTFSVGAAPNFNESVVSLGYDEDGIRTNSNSHQTYATLIQTGNLYGLAYQRALRLIFAGTYFKSYADTGPVQTSGWLQNVDPLGAIYAITPVALAGNPANNNNARVYANLNKIKDPTSADPFIPSNPAGVDPRRTGGINYDINDCDGPNGTAPQAYPATNASCWQHDPVAFDKVGTIGLGDVEADDEEKTIFVVNLADKKLYQLPVIADTNQWPIQTLAAPPVTIPNNCANPADAVPGGLGFKDGNLYVGVTCTAKSSQDTDDLKAEVWRYNPQTQVFSASPVFSLDLDFPRGCIFSGFDTGEIGQGGINAPKNNLNSINTTNCQSYNNGNSPVVIDSANWNPWPTNWQDLFTSNMGINTPGKPGHTAMDFIQIEHPSPWLSDISFDGDDLVLGFRDTNGDRMGNIVRSPNITTNTALPTVYRVQDQFGAQVYSNNNGNVNWSNNWTETGETTNPTADDIQIINNVSNYQLRLQGAGNSIQRSTSSSASPAGINSTTGTLSFAYRRVNMDSADVVTVEVSTNGGTTYTAIATISGSGAGVTDPTYRTAIYQISLGTNTVLRFSTNASMSGTNQLFLDNVEIMNATPAWMTQYTYQYTGAAFGDLLRACWNGASWDLESNGACGGLVTPGANNGQGPGTGTYPGTISSPFTGYGEFYWDDSGPGSRNANSGVASNAFFNPAGFATGTMYRGHEQTMMGGIFQQAGLPDTAVTIADQFGFGDGGLSRFSNVANHPQITLEANGNLLPLRTYPTVLADGSTATGNEAGLALRHTQLYNNADGFFAKANGLGDVEGLLDSAPLELGNRLWCDTGVSGVGAYNGIQDPGETPAPNGITVRLTCGAQYAEVNTSGGTGSYLFTDAIWDASANAAGIIPRNTTCTISVSTEGANGTALTNTCGGIAATVPNAQGDTSNSPVNDIRDSDATVVLTGGNITSAQIQVLTGGPGGNNHGLDFGFGARQDYGDAPDPTYPTLAASNGARHTIVANIRMGPAVDSEQNGQPNVAATGDDTANVDDEDGVTFSALTAGQPAVASINMAGLSGTPVCYLNAWIDFNGNGSWLDAGEQIATNIALNGGGVVPVNFTVPPAVTTSPTYARFRCSTQQNLSPTGPAPDGEVEDYREILQQTASLDYGDAPDPTYPTLSISGGASHVLGQSGPRLGACVDAEANGQPLVGATGDDAALGAPVFGVCTNNDDEDGITIPTLTEGSASNITVVVSNAACVLNAWIDYNGDGDWNDAGEQIATNLPRTVGSTTFSVTPPAAATQAPTYARFRCSTQTGLGFTGAAADGEVEDYVVSILSGPNANDWGDAPDTGTGTSTGNYQTVGTDNGAHHLIVAGVYLGACVDAEANGQPNAGANGDDSNGGTATGACAVAGDDEDGVTIPTLLAGQTAQVTVSRTAATACYLNGWIDFNNNGSWLDAGEQVATNLLLPSGNTNLAVNVPGGAVNGPTYARFRCSTQQNLAPTGVASDGEVEDYAVQITGTAVDWGDLPDGPYATLSANNGPAHVLSGVAFMGKCVDAELNGQPNAGATGDDGNATTPRLGACASGNDDEDGVTFGTLTAGTNGTANVDMSAFNTGAQVCFLNAWIDFNGNGSFADAGDQIASNVQMIGGAAPNAVTFAIPSVVTSSPTGARFRCSTQSNLPPIGQAPNGEVEDYMVTLVPQSRDFGDAPDTSAGTGVGNYNTTVADNGPSHLIISNLRLGAVNPDADSGALQNANANADDNNNTDDEDGVATIPAVNSATTAVALQVTVFNNTASQATVACWIDFNRDGVFSASERASATVAANSGTTTPTLNFSGFGAPVPGLSYLRCRIANAAGEVADATGPAATGEVEDYPLNISGTDYGDAPDTAPGTGVGNYNTLGTDNGPYHVIVSGLNLGAVAPDNDPATLQDTAASADNTTNVDDEDGISVLPQIFSNSTSIQMNVSASNTTANAAVMACWIDFNRDGDFLDTGEKSANVAVPASSGTQTYPVSLSGFAPPTLGVTYIRCRIAFSAGDIANPTGSAASGEVEDYRTDQALSVTLASFDAASQSDHVLVSWETVSEANNAGFNLYRSLSADGQRTLLTYAPSQAPGSTVGAAYSFQDANVSGGQTYWYWLEDIDLAGAATLHGPVSVVYQAPTAVTLSGMAADGAPGNVTLFWILAALLAAGAGLVALWRRRATA